MTYDLTEKAQELFKEAPDLQQKWVDAVNYLRTQSNKGWMLDSSGVNLNKRDK